MIRKDRIELSFEIVFLKSLVRVSVKANSMKHET